MLEYRDMSAYELLESLEEMVEQLKRLQTHEQKLALLAKYAEGFSLQIKTEETPTSRDNT